MFDLWWMFFLAKSELLCNFLLSLFLLALLDFAHRCTACPGRSWSELSQGSSVPGLGSQDTCVVNRIGLSQELEPFSFVHLWMPGQGEGLQMLALLGVLLCYSGQS